MGERVPQDAVLAMCGLAGPGIGPRRRHPNAYNAPRPLGDLRDSRLALIVRTNIELLVEPLARPALALWCDHAQLAVMGDHASMLQKGNGVAPVALRTARIMTLEDVIDRWGG